MSLLFRSIGWVISIAFAMAALGSVIGGGPAFATGLCLAGLAVAINPQWRVSIVRRFASFSILLFLTVVVMGMEVQSSGLGEFSAQAMFTASLVVLITFGIRQAKPPINKSEFTQDDLNHLIVLCEGVLQDDEIAREEADALRHLFRSNPDFEDVPRIKPVVMAVEKALEDGRYDAEKAVELRNIISEFYDYILHYDEPLSSETPDSGLTDSDTQNPGVPDYGVPDSSLTVPVVQDSGVPGNDVPDSDEPNSVLPVQKVENDPTAITPPAPGDVFTITYGNIFGMTREKKIKYRSASKIGDNIYIDAFCFDTKAYCTFRADRIIEASNTESGARIADAATYFS